MARVENRGRFEANEEARHRRLALSKVTNAQLRGLLNDRLLCECSLAEIEGELKRRDEREANLALRRGTSE